MLWTYWNITLFPRLLFSICLYLWDRFVPFTNPVEPQLTAAHWSAGTGHTEGEHVIWTSGSDWVVLQEEVPWLCRPAKRVHLIWDEQPVSLGDIMDHDSAPWQSGSWPPRSCCWVRHRQRTGTNINQTCNGNVSHVVLITHTQKEKIKWETLRNLRWVFTRYLHEQW